MPAEAGDEGGRRTVLTGQESVMGTKGRLGPEEGQVEELGVGGPRGRFCSLPPGYGRGASSLCHCADLPTGLSNRLLTLCVPNP